MINFPTSILDCYSHSPVFLDLFLSFDASICSAVVFLLLGNCDWDGLHDHLRDVLWEDTIKHSASAVASGFCE